MAPAIIVKFIRRNANKFANYVGARVCHEYDEATLQAQTIMLQAKMFIHDSIVVKVYKDAERAYTSLKTTFSTELVALTPKSSVRGNNRGRIDKAKYSRQGAHTIKNNHTEARRKRSSRKPKPRTLERKRNVPAPAAKHVASARIAVPEAPSPKDCTTPMCQERPPSPDYMEELRCLYPASEDYIERSKRIQACLTAILGSERMNLGVGTPSGHTGISEDPILVKYNQEKYIQDMKNLYEQHQIMLRQQHEQQQLQAAEEAAKRQYAETQLAIYCSTYEERVAALARLGHQFHIEMAKLGQAYDQDIVPALESTVHILIHEVLEPAEYIFREMEQQIALEQQGADIIKSAWPLHAIEKVFEVFDDQAIAQFPEIVQKSLCHMLQCMQVVCQRIISAKPWVNPLLQQQPEALQSFQTISQPQFEQLYSPVSQPMAVDIDAGKNFASFSDLGNATKASGQAQASVPQIELTALNNDVPTASSEAPAAASSGSDKKATLLSYMDTSILEFQDNTKKFVRDGRVQATQRQDCEAVLTWMDERANQESGILGSEEGQTMKREIQLLLRKIADLNNKERKKSLNREVEILANRVMKIWA